MEIKSSLLLEVKKGDYVFRLELPVGSNIGDAYEATWEMLNKITELAKESVDKAKRPEKEPASGDE